MLLIHLEVWVQNLRDNNSLQGWINVCFRLISELCEEEICFSCLPELRVSVWYIHVACSWLYVRPIANIYQYCYWYTLSQWPGPTNQKFNNTKTTHQNHSSFSFDFFGGHIRTCCCCSLCCHSVVIPQTKSMRLLPHSILLSNSLLDNTAARY